MTQSCHSLSVGNALTVRVHLEFQSPFQNEDLIAAELVTNLIHQAHPFRDWHSVVMERETRTSNDRNTSYNFTATLNCAVEGRFEFTSKIRNNKGEWIWISSYGNNSNIEVLPMQSERMSNDAIYFQPTASTPQYQSTQFSASTQVHDIQFSEYSPSLPYSYDIVYNGGSEPKRYVDMTRKEIEQIQRQQKRGTEADGTEGAHIVSHELAKGILREIPGRRVAQNADELIYVLQSDENIRIKTEEGNRLDRVVDNIIIEKFKSDEPLTTKAEIHRAAQVVKKAQELEGQSPTLDTLSKHVGQMQIHTGNPGRPQTVTSYVNTPPPTNIDMRSSAYQSGEVKLRSDGGVDNRCSAYRSGSAITKNDGTLDGRSAVCRDGSINFKSSSPSKSSGSQSRSPSKRK